MKSPTPFGLPVFFNKKEIEGEVKKRPVVDIRGLEAITITDAYPMPLQSDVRRRLRAALSSPLWIWRRYSINGPRSESDRQARARTLHRRPDGLRPMPGGQDDTAGKSYCTAFCEAYIDDFTVFSWSFEDYLAHLRRMFSEFQGVNLNQSPTKTFLGPPSNCSVSMSTVWGYRLRPRSLNGLRS